MGTVWENIAGLWAKLDTTPLPSGLVLGVALPVLAVFLYIAHRQQNPGRRKAARIETMMSQFARAGLVLRDDRDPNDVLIPFPVETYLDDPMVLLLTYGDELEQDGVWVPYSDQVVNFDYECIDYPEIYAEDIVPRFARLAGLDVKARFENGTLTYVIGRAARSITPVIDDDWADQAAVNQILIDVQAALPDGHTLWTTENGQAEILSVMTVSAMTTLSRETGIKFAPRVAKPRR